MSSRLHPIQPAIFDDGDVIAGFSTRPGGVSLGHFSSLNLSFSVNDVEERVRQNRQLFFGHFSFDAGSIATAGQVHGTDVEYVGAPGFSPETDGLVTDVAGIPLCITAADCAAVLLADERHRVIGACHAGWRGVAGNIVEKTIHVMRDRGARISALKAFISPCISQQHFEVGEEVARVFDEKYVDRSPAKPHVDLKHVIHDQLSHAGLDPTKIEISPVCTFADATMFFSHRAHQGMTGRMMAFIALTDAQTWKSI